MVAVIGRMPSMSPGPVRERTSVALLALWIGALIYAVALTFYAVEVNAGGVGSQFRSPAPRKPSQIAPTPPARVTPMPAEVEISGLA